MRSKKLLGSICAALILLIAPTSALAFPFGGNASLVIPCYNGVIYALLGPPIGGPYLWSPSTLTYRFGPPTHSGQWVLGNAGPPYFCLVSILPIITYPGTVILMMGSSQ